MHTHTSTHTCMHTHAFALELTHTLVEPGFRHRAVCPHRGGTPPPDVLGNNIWVTPAGPPPPPRRNSTGRPRSRQAGGSGPGFPDPPPHVSVCLFPWGLEGGGEGRWSLGVCVSGCVCLSGTDVYVCAPEAACEPVLRGTGRVPGPVLPTEAGPGWPATCRQRRSGRKGRRGPSSGVPAGWWEAAPMPSPTPGGRGG